MAVKQELGNQPNAAVLAKKAATSATAPFGQGWMLVATHGVYGFSAKTFKFARASLDKVVIASMAAGMSWPGGGLWLMKQG